MQTASQQSNKKATDEQEVETQEISYKTTHTAVRKARRFAMQGLYEWLMTDYRFAQNGQTEWQANPPHDIVARTRATNAMHTVHLGYYHQMMRDIPQQIEELNVLIEAELDREITKLDMIEHAILLIGSYELKHSLHIPYKVVLDESMKLNTHFGATDAHKLINAVLDKMAKKLRSAEVAANANNHTTNSNVGNNDGDNGSHNNNENSNDKKQATTSVEASTDVHEAQESEPQLEKEPNLESAAIQQTTATPQTETASEPTIVVDNTQHIDTQSDDTQNNK